MVCREENGVDVGGGVEREVEREMEGERSRGRESWRESIWLLLCWVI